MEIVFSLFCMCFWKIRLRRGWFTFRREFSGSIISGKYFRVIKNKNKTNEKRLKFTFNLDNF